MFRSLCQNEVLNLMGWKRVQYFKTKKADWLQSDLRYKHHWNLRFWSSFNWVKPKVINCWNSKQRDFFTFAFEENLRCGSDVLRVAADVIGQCSAKKCRFKCVGAGKRPNQRNAKCKKNLYWKVKYREISCDYIVKNWNCK